MARGRPRLDRAREESPVVSVEELVEQAQKYLNGWIETLGEAGKPVKKGEDVAPGNVPAAVAGIKILTDYLSQTQRKRAERMLEKAAKARRQAVKELKGG